MAPPVKTAGLPPKVLVPEGEGRVVLVTGMGNGAAMDDVATGVTEAGVEEAGLDGSTMVEEGTTGAAVLEDATMPAATV